MSSAMTSGWWSGTTITAVPTRMCRVLFARCSAYINGRDR